MNEVKSPKKPLIYYYMIVVLLVLLFNLLAMPWLAEHQIKEVDYNTFVSMTEKNEIGQVDFLTVQFSGHLGCLSHVELCQCTFSSSVTLCKGLKEGRKIIRIKSFRGKAFHIVTEISLFLGSKSSTGTRKLFFVAGFG